MLARDPERSILRWAWTRHAAQRAAYAAQADERWVRLTDREQVQRFLAGIRTPEKHPTPSPHSDPPLDSGG